MVAKVMCFVVVFPVINIATSSTTDSSTTESTSDGSIILVAAAAAVVLEQQNSVDFCLCNLLVSLAGLGTGYPVMSFGSGSATRFRLQIIAD